MIHMCIKIPEAQLKTYPCQQSDDSERRTESTDNEHWNNICTQTQLSFDDGLKYDYERKDKKGINAANKLSVRYQVIITKSHWVEMKKKSREHALTYK